MPMATIDGIATHYEVAGSGPPLLMYAPGGFDATLDKWRTLGVYAKIRLLDHLPARYTCITFDRRETGRSGGRVERVGWGHYVAQGRGLLDHLGFGKAFLMGGCMGCSPVIAFGVAHPERVLGMVLFWPVGGVRYRLNAHSRFGQHLAYLEDHTLADVVALAKSHEHGFGKDPRVGPWASVLRSDASFAEGYARLDLDEYKLVVAGMARTLVDRDTAPGAEPEDLLRLRIPALVVPGRDASHATSAARYLEECLPLAEYFDVPVADQTADNVPQRVLAFLDGVSARQG
jgi:pimeloyl-ACP methyl ester carboxylesterase